jgi:serine/threonine protein kinase
MAVTLEQFVQTLTKTGLMRADEIDAIRTQHPTLDANGLATELIKASKLTRYQADLLGRGEERGLVLGEYIVVDRIGAGGMGEVLKAWHRRMDRFAAIKIMSRQLLDSPGAVQRFYQEVKAAARLSHPNIVHAYDANEQDGTHYLVMEYVRGRNLEDILRDEGPLPVPQALECVFQAAHGLAYAHAQGVVHRDIKPGNLLLDEWGQVKILDMGLAVMATGGAAEKTLGGRLTEFGQMMGTPEYMAPEQAENSRSADHRADIYSLGCTLYRLLIGKPPYPGNNIVDWILGHREKPIPSLRAERDEVPDQVDEIFRKMAAKRPEDRFQSMFEVIASLQSCLATSIGVAANMISPLQTGSSAFVSGPPTPIANSMQRTAIPAVAKPLPRSSETMVELPTGQQTGLATKSSTTRLLVLSGAGVVAASLLMALILVLAGVFREAPGKDPADNTSNGQPSGAEEPNKKQKPKTDKPKELRPEYALEGHEGEIEAVAVSRDGSRIISGGADKVLIVWDGESKKRLKTLSGHKTKIRCLAISPDGKFAVSGAFDEPVKYWNLESGQLIRDFDGHGMWVGAVAFSPDVKYFASAGWDQKLRIWNLDKRTKLVDTVAHDGWVRGVAFSNDGKRVITGGNDTRVKIWDAKTGEMITTLGGHKQVVGPVTFSHDDKLAASGSYDYQIILWDLSKNEIRKTLEGHRESPVGLAFTPNGKYLLSASYDKTARVWEVASGTCVYEFKKHEAPVTRIACMPNIPYVVSVGLDKMVRIWKLPVPSLP